jgi:CMP-N-acetylneuraminic acid synthetase
MYSDKKIVALITARGGSKGIRNKNINPLAGKPLIAWTIEEAKKSTYLDKIITSTEDSYIMEIAKAYGSEIPFERPKYLAQDDTSSIDVILHAIEHLKEQFDYLLLLQPTSPFRKLCHIDKIIEACIDSEAQAMVSVSKVKKHPYHMYEISGDYLRPILNKKSTFTRRQDMPPIYEYNGALYLSSISFIKEKQSFVAPEIKPFEMDVMHSIDIDEMLDWDFAELLIKKGVI